MTKYYTLLFKLSKNRIKHFIFVAALAFFSVARGQTYHLLILDSITSKPITEVEVQTQLGSLFSDDNGEVVLKKSAGEHIILAHLNYVTKYVVFSEEVDTVLLVRNLHQLSEISVNPTKRDDYFEVGYYHTKKHYQINCGLNVAVIIATFVQAPLEQVYLDEIMLRMKPKQFAKQYCVYLYKPDKMGMPGKILYKRVISVDSLKKEGVINVHELFIKMPKSGIFIGLENIEPYNPDYVPVRFYSFRDPNPKIAYITRNDVEINPKGVWISLQGNMDDYHIPCFGLRVYQK